MKRIMAAVGALVASTAIAACGSSHAKTPSTINPAGTTPTSTVDTNAYKTSRLTEQQAGTAFLNAVHPVNAAIEAAAGRLKQLAAGKSEDMASVAAPAAAALSRLNGELRQLGQKYPVAEEDLTNLEQSYQPLILDFQDLKHVDAHNYKAWERQYVKDVKLVKVDDATVRMVLGLPKNG